LSYRGILIILTDMSGNPCAETILTTASLRVSLGFSTGRNSGCRYGRNCSAQRFQCVI